MPISYRTKGVTHHTFVYVYKACRKARRLHREKLRQAGAGKRPAAAEAR
ncbi:MAG: hypothetical protein QM775_17635 [Pirellulales bacterium]